jgi:hypothetical protein
MRATAKAINRQPNGLVKRTRFQLDGMLNAGT